MTLLTTVALVAIMFAVLTLSLLVKDVLDILEEAVKMEKNLEELMFYSYKPDEPCEEECQCEICQMSKGMMD